MTLALWAFNAKTKAQKAPAWPWDTNSCFFRVGRKWIPLWLENHKPWNYPRKQLTVLLVEVNKNQQKKANPNNNKSKWSSQIVIIDFAAVPEKQARPIYG